MSSVTYTGRFRDTIDDYVANHGGIVRFRVSSLQNEHVAFGEFVKDNDLTLYCEGSPVSSVSDMFVLLRDCGYGTADSDGANTEGGNAANCVVGNFSMYPHIHLDTGDTLADVVYRTSKATQKTKSAKVTKPKEPRMLKADKRIMRPENATKGGNVWNPEYIKTKEIDVNRCYELWGGKTEFYTAMKTMTVYEFEATYGLRAK